MARAAANTGEKGGAKGGSRRIIWVLASAFLICWAFFLGVLVGQGSLATPDQMATWQRWLASLPGMKDPAAVEPKKEAQGTPTDLTFYQGLARKKPEPTAQAKAKPAVPATAKPAAPAKAQSQATPAAKGRYSVQVASLKDQAKALEILNRLKRSGLNGYVVRAEIKNLGPRYRVRVGPFTNLTEATEAAGSIRLKHKLPAYVAMD